MTIKKRQEGRVTSPRSRWLLIISALLNGSWDALSQWTGCSLWSTRIRPTFSAWFSQSGWSIRACPHSNSVRGKHRCGFKGWTWLDLLVFQRVALVGVSELGDRSLYLNGKSDCLEYLSEISTFYTDESPVLTCSFWVNSHHSTL